MAYQIIPVDITVYDWFESADEQEKAEMYHVCKEYFNAEEVEPKSVSELEFIELLKGIKERYLSLTTEQIDQLKNI